MKNNAPSNQSVFNSVVKSAKALDDLVSSWRDENGDYVFDRFPVVGESEDLETLAEEIDSACQDIFETTNGIACGKMDSSDFDQLLVWQEYISDAFDDLAMDENARAVCELNECIEALFRVVAEASEVLGDKLLGRRDFYVYVHKDSEGKVFYVGKGTGRRAWKKDRHPLWHKYVEERLNGVYEVEIIKPGLLEHEAEAAEEEVMSQYPGQLVNWIQGSSAIKLEAGIEDGAVYIKSSHANFDHSYHDALNKFHQMRKKNCSIVACGRNKENSAPADAEACYREAIEQLSQIAQACPKEPGLKGELEELWTPLGVDLEPLDRLTILLAREGKYLELVREVDSFFEKFPYSNDTSVAERIIKRRDKASNALLRSEN